MRYIVERYDPVLVSRPCIQRIGTIGFANPASATTPAPPQAPAAPTDLSAAAVSISQINLTWGDNASNETGFRIERSPDGTTFTEIAPSVQT